MKKKKTSTKGLKKGDLVLCIKKYIREDDESTPYPNETCIVSDVDGDDIALEGYKSFYPESYFELK